jgi:lipoprotein-anchoring transpeptidase ErfK/SrfK
MPAQPAGGFLGSWAVHLTAHSEVLEDYGGGPGRVAIHGRGGASFLDPLGTAASHGCIRSDDDVVARIVSAARPGTPVTIHG